ncbi:MAG TPA: glycosyltransferase family 4 protein [Elusimicrobiota bacterium]|nr:glycosyltransferase family 4 protein [Elusimicrobiota bacterium]
MPRVAMVIARFHPYAVGGAERQALELSKALVARGSPVLVVTRLEGGAPAGESLGGVEILRLPAGTLAFMIACVLALLRRRGEIDAIHAHLAGSPALAAAFAGRLLGKPVVVKLGGGKGISEVALAKGSILGRLKLALLRALRPAFVGVAAEIAEEARAAGLPVAATIPNGVDLRRYRPADAEGKGRLRESLGWPSGRIFLYAGRFAPEKRLDLALRRWAAARPSAEDLLVLVGEGPEAPALRRAAGDAPVLFLSPQEELAELYRAADVFVLPSVSEGLSNALLEAMASGSAVLASRVGGTAETVPPEAGILFDRDDEAGLEHGFERLIKESGLAAELGRGARRVAEGFGIEKTAERYLALYRGGETRASPH